VANDYPTITVRWPCETSPNGAFISWQPGDPTQSYLIEAAADLADDKEREGDGRPDLRLRCAST